MDKKYFTTYILILLIGIYLFLSLFEVAVGPFDWATFIIFITYFVIFYFFESFIVDKVVEKNDRVVVARLKAHDSYNAIEKNNKWEEYKKYIIDENTVFNFYYIYNLYFFKSQDYLNKRKNAKLSEKELKKAYLSKKLKQLLRGERMGCFRKRKILKLEKTQDDASFVDKTRLRYKKGEFLGKRTHEAGDIFGVVLGLVSLVITILSFLHFKIDNAFYGRLIFMSIVVLADCFSVYGKIKTKIQYEIDISNTAESLTAYLFENKTLEKNKAYVYHFFNSIKLPHE